jgi:hypothetical protein
MAYLAFTVAFIVPSLRYAVSLVGLTAWNVLEGLLPILACGVAMAISVYAIGSVLPEEWGPLAHLNVQIPCGGAIYWLLVHQFRLSAYHDVRSILMGRTAVGA